MTIISLSVFSKTKEEINTLSTGTIPFCGNMFIAGKYFINNGTIPLFFSIQDTFSTS